MSEYALKKRKTDNEPELDIKRSKSQDHSQNGELIKTNSEHSGCLLGETMLLSGHKSDVLSLRFSPDGKYLASASRDKTIFLWNAFDSCDNWMTLKGHGNAVVQVEWSSDNRTIYSASSDKTLGSWDTETGQRLLKYNEHESYLNALSLGNQNTIASVSDDCTCRLWDVRSKYSTSVIQMQYQQTAVSINQDRHLVFTGGLDNIIKAWDIRNPSTAAWNLLGHGDTIASLRLDPQGIFLLSNSMDHTMRIWDIRPYAPEHRCTKTLYGATHGLDRNLLRCNWRHDGAFVTSGSFDRLVYIWDVLSGQIKCILPGHQGTVNEVDFHPNERIVASCSADGKIYIGQVNQLD